MLKIKVKNMVSPRSGKEVANQFLIYTDEGVYFQSYNAVIAFKPKGFTVFATGVENRIVLDEKYWNYSVTTSKYRNEFLSEGTRETKENIKLGFYVLANLN